jgi:hypothetical protein
MNRRLLIYGMMLFALLFQSLAHAMPCCAVMDELQPKTTQTAMMNDMVQDTEDGCFAGSPICCAVPSLTYVAAVLDPKSISPVHVPTVTTLSISQHQIPPDRPPRV